MKIAIVIPSKRRVIKTLDSYDIPTGMQVFILSDPEVLPVHKLTFAGLFNVTVLEGRRGMGAQSSYCYQVAYDHGYSHFFRMDDDLEHKTFVGKDGTFPDLQGVISECQRAMEEQNVSLVGLANTTNRHWMSVGYKRTYGLIHGGANLSISHPIGALFCEPSLVRGEDIYRTCAHRQMDLDSGRDGMVGRVSHIGFNKKSSTVTAGQTSITATPEAIEESRQLILRKFPHMVTCNGTRFINGGKDEIVNWRFTRTKVQR